MSTYINLHNGVEGTPCYRSGDLDRLEARLAEQEDSLSRPATWALIVAGMDDAIREQVHGELAPHTPCTPRKFLARYLDLADAPLVLG